MSYFDLQIPSHAYMFGFIQADGHLQESSRNRGKMTLEINIQDEDILPHFVELFPCDVTVSHRIRTTNFKLSSSAILSVFDLKIRKELISLGMPVGRKDTLIQPPSVPFSKRDYFRGLVDANGSVGMTSKPVPFLSLCAPSEFTSVAFTEYVAGVTGLVKNPSRNKRDNIYNIALYTENAQEMIREIYYPSCLSLKRKYENALSALKWERPSNMRKVCGKRFWEEWEDLYIKSHSLSESVAVLKRSEQSIKMRLWRISK